MTKITILIHIFFFVNVPKRFFPTCNIMKSQNFSQFFTLYSRFSNGFQRDGDTIRQGAQLNFGGSKKNIMSQFGECM